MESGLEVRIIGSGTVYQEDERRQSCVVVRSGGETLAFDLGSGAMRGMMRHGFDRSSLDRVFFTHFHADHTADIVPLLDTMNYTTAAPRTKTLHVSGPEPFLEFIDSFPDVWKDGMQPRDYRLTLTELPLDCEAPLELAGCSITWARASHRPESISYRVEDSVSGRAFVYTGDTDYCRSVADLASGAHTLLTECSTTEERRIPGHMDPSSVARIARKAGIERVVLTHVFPQTRAEDPAGKVRREFDGEVLLAEDGMELRI